MWFLYVYVSVLCFATYGPSATLKRGMYDLVFRTGAANSFQQISKIVLVGLQTSALPMLLRKHVGILQPRRRSPTCFQTSTCCRPDSLETPELDAELL